MVRDASGHIAFRNINLGLAYLRTPLFGFPLTVQNLVLSDSGLTVGSAALDLSGVSGVVQLKQASLAVDGVRLSPGNPFQITFSGISASLEADLFGADVVARSIRIGDAGLTIGTATVTLPGRLGGGSADWTVRNFIIRRNGTFDGGLAFTRGVSFALADLTVRADNGFEIGSNVIVDSSSPAGRPGIRIPTVSLSLPVIPDSFGSPITLNNLTFDGSHFALGGAGATATYHIGPYSLDPSGTFRFEGDMGFSLDDTNGRVSYTLIGKGKIGVVGASVDAYIEIGTVDDTYPSHLHLIQINFQIPAPGLQIGTTPFYIIGGGGTVAPTGSVGAVHYTMALPMTW